MNTALLRREVQEFMQENLKSDLSRLVLKGSPFPDISVQQLATQLVGMQKAENKLPSWYASQDVLYPPNINLEQTSSEITARYKASLVNGDTLLDLTGGFGVDDLFFAEKFEKVIHCELNQELSEIARHNFRALGANNVISFRGNGIEYLKTLDETPDWIFLDPSRRDDYGGKVFLLEHCSPDVVGNMELLFSKTSNIMIKTSPLLDLSAGMRELGKVTEIHIVAVNNEVKELLWILNKKAAQKPWIKTINFKKNTVQRMEASVENLQEPVPLCYPKEFLFEPNAAIMKSGLFASLAEITNTCKLHLNSHLFTSSEAKEFPGRSFRILDSLAYNKKLTKKTADIKKAHITTRNFPVTVEAIRKKLKIKDGGNLYLFFTTTQDEEKVVLVCEKLFLPIDKDITD